MPPVPSCAGPADEVKDLAWLHGKRVDCSTFVIQLRHKAFQDIERRKPSDTAAIEGQQAEPGLINGVWFPALLLCQRLFHRCGRRLGGDGSFGDDRRGERALEE